ncbi:DUF2799 domain-containing protein [Undibacterium sp. Dicai25W]|uniref:DUF2799 domain-containing protein n=1 Tax=Undibacterium sp. Dicai25W TaxID=3413034 RepID=UPI003BEFC2C4
MANNFYRSAIIVLSTSAALLLSACESMSPEQCKVADWARTGREDGSKGESRSNLADYTKDCAKVGVTPSPSAYYYGWDQGIATFCTPQRGWREGMDGNGFKRDACAGQAGEPGFVMAFDRAYQIYNINQQLTNIASTSRDLERRLSEAKTDDERNSLRRQLRDQDKAAENLRFNLQLMNTVQP